VTWKPASACTAVQRWHRRARGRGADVVCVGLVAVAPRAERPEHRPVLLRMVRARLRVVQLGVGRAPGPHLSRRLPTPRPPCVHSKRARVATRAPRPRTGAVRAGRRLRPVCTVAITKRRAGCVMSAAVVVWTAMRQVTRPCISRFADSFLFAAARTAAQGHGLVQVLSWLLLSGWGVL